MLVCTCAGWELAQSLLRPRSIEVDDDGRVSFVSQSGFQRIGAQEALRHRFLRPAAEHERNLKRSLGSVSTATTSAEESFDESPLASGSGSRNRSGSGGRRAPGSASGRNGRGGSSSASADTSRSGSGSSRAGSGSSRAGSGWWGLGRKKVPEPVEEEEEVVQPVAAAASSDGGLFTAAAGLWRGLQDRLFDLEARMIKTASETAKQTTRVQKLEAKVSCNCQPVRNCM